MNTSGSEPTSTKGMVRANMKKVAIQRGVRCHTRRQAWCDGLRQL